MLSKHSKAAAAAAGIAFKTHDFCFARSLRSIGRDLCAEERRKIFPFHDRSTRHQDVLPFHDGDAAVPSVAFPSIIKDRKALLHNA